ncbi:conserved hypothetical protein [Candidatus Desulfarcum epimagneticum]|uniref:Uncharacterized protein n=1 Tax=uncultured Desulfobacteraceae bacterium TaxID=218296 RepID=A0A484HGI8_9BACT|nr:conserved hypothetical protein [uncultured Desulfobacteraceae bacterium]
MINKQEWIKDWEVDDDCYQTSKSLVEIFDRFLFYLENEKKLSKRTIKKHASSCHALGGYIINDLYNNSFPSGDVLKFGKELLMGYDIQYEAPLIYHDNESRQNEIDASCRQLYKYLTL